MMVGCERWCNASLTSGFGANKRVSSRADRPLGEVCREEIFHSTREEYIQLLRDRDATPPVKSNREIRKILDKTATRTTSKECETGLYCATASQPMIESLIVNQVYQFATGKRPLPITTCRFNIWPIRNPNYYFFVHLLDSVLNHLNFFPVVCLHCRPMR